MLSYVSEQTNLTKFLKHSSVAVTSQLVVAFLFSRSIYVLRKLTYLGVIVSTCYGQHPHVGSGFETCKRHVLLPPLNVDQSP